MSMSVNYTFPRINGFQQVEPYLSSHFSVKEQNGLVYINYRLNTPETFPPVTDYGTAVMREFRGIAFDIETGAVISRPFHKFFNLNEREDMDFEVNGATLVDEKLDGSMVRPVLLPDGSVRWATKAGITDVSMQAETFLSTKPEYEKFVRFCFGSHLTPIFEYTAPNNRIILDYDQPSVTLLAIRNMRTGIYQSLPSYEPLLIQYGIPWVRPSSLTVDEAKAVEGAEGIVLTQPDGHKVKVKSDWYVTRHRGKSLVENERKVLRLLLEGTLDDVLPVVDEETRGRLTRYEIELEQRLEDILEELEVYYDSCRQQFSTRKDYALAAQCVPSHYPQYVFGVWSGKVKDGMDFLVSLLKKSVGSKARYQQVTEQLYLPSLLTQHE